MRTLEEMGREKEHTEERIEIEVSVSSALCILSVIHVSGDINLFYIVIRIHHLYL